MYLYIYIYIEYIFLFIASDTINQTFNDILDMSNDLLKSIETSYILINEYIYIYINNNNII